jgi:very-short-patch-repair endonuclease
VLHDADRTVWRGIPVTTIARTLVDLDHELPDEKAFEQIVRETMFRGLFDAGAVAEALTRKQARRLAGFVDDRVPTQTEMENRLLRICRRHRIATPLTQRGDVPRVDFLWPDARLVIEVDGRAAHLRPTAFENDRRRDVELRLAGYDVHRFTWRQVVHDPAYVRRALTALLASPRPRP